MEKITDEYIEKCTDSWKLLRGNEIVGLWEYGDRVDWEMRYAIKVKGEVKATFSEKEVNPYQIYDIIAACV